jgi:hypothetical protein
MTLRDLVVPCGSHHCRHDVCRPGIARRVGKETQKSSFGTPSWHFRSMGKSVGHSVGNCTRHPASMSRVTRKDFGGPAGRSRPLSRRGGRCRSEGLAPGASRPRASPWEIATLLYGTLSALAGPTTTASRQSAGRVAPPDGLTLNSEETQLDCCPNVPGTSVGQEAGPIGEARGDSPHGVVAAVRENPSRLRGSVHGPTS